MIVTAALIWWNERPEDLARCVRGLGTIADRLVAVDGAYARYPGATIAGEGTAEVDAIDAAASSAGIKVVDIVTPSTLWAGQVQKRAFALGRAAEGSDWVAIADADWIISGNRPAARRFLRRTKADVISVPFYTVPAPGRAVASGWHSATSGGTDQLAHLFRALPGLTCERHHWSYSAVKNGERVWLWGGDDPSRRLIPQTLIEADYQIKHMTLHRTEEQVLASRAFLNDRIMVVNATGQEDDRPDLPRPVFDYETIPYAG